MDKRFGAEGVHGLGGGMVSRESQENLKKAEDLCRKMRPNEAAPFLMEAMKDENNLDAHIQLAFLCETDKPFGVEVLETAERIGRGLMLRRLGPNAFSDNGPHIGNFGAILDTRPYMRVLQAQVRMYFETQQYTRSVETMIEMLRLCPGDNMGQRSWLGSFLLRVGRDADALFFAQVWLKSFQGHGEPPLRGGTAFRPPRRGLLTDKDEKELSKSGPGELLHTAALASFRLWGNCPEAVQYLRIAARANPHVLVKILGRRSQPVAPKMNPRGRNSPEDAHDYRWITQDLWTETRVWNWIANDVTVNAELLKGCSHRDCDEQETTATQFRRCSACHQVTYCGQKCQKGDWKRHKTECREHEDRKKAIRDFATNKPNTKIPVLSADFATGGAPVLYDGSTVVQI
ncbi:hypothetical protein C8R46DRAFT_473579 [Mycena filopes]|nr:hypothetical protein C8R46DRAFT_473579 [Mycena filopes]